MDVLVPYAAALVSFALAGALRRRRRYAWAAALASYAFAACAMAWGAADGWDARTFRVYYLAGGMLTAPLLGVGSLLFTGRRWAAPVGFLYSGFALGVAVTMHVHGVFGPGIPAAQAHLDWLPRGVAIAANSLGSLTVILVALVTLRRRPLGNCLIIAGVAVAAAGSGLSGLGVSGAGGFVLVAACLLYLGVAGLPFAPRAALTRWRGSRAGRG